MENSMGEIEISRSKMKKKLPLYAFISVHCIESKSEKDTVLYDVYSFFDFFRYTTMWVTCKANGLFLVVKNNKCGTNKK